MNILSVTFDDDMWQEVSQFAQSCSWRAGKALSQSMSDNAFTAWERVIVALHENDIAGYCTVAKSDCIPNVPYTPYMDTCSLMKNIEGNVSAKSSFLMQCLI